MTRRKNPESYPESYWTIFREGARRNIEIPLDSHKEAQRTRAELYSFRSQLRKAEHPFHIHADKVILRIRDNYLIAEPDDRLNKILRSQGIEVGPPEETTEGPSESVLEQLHKQGPPGGDDGESG